MRSAAAGPGRGTPRLRSRLVRGDDRGQHADFVSDAALRVRAFLSARRGSAGDSDKPDLSRRSAVHRHPADRPNTAIYFSTIIAIQKTK